MNRYNLYRAIGDIDDRYTEDVLAEEARMYRYSHSSDGYSYGERTIVMDVVNRKKKNHLFIAVAVIAAAAVTAAAAAGIMKNGKEKIKKEPEIKLFTAEAVTLPEHCSSVQNGYIAGDKLYLDCFYEGDKTETVFRITDTETGSETKISADAEINYSVSSAVSEKCIYIADRNKKGIIQIKSFDINSGMLLREKSEESISVIGMNYDAEKNTINLIAEKYGEDSLTHTEHIVLDADSLETLSAGDITEFINSNLSDRHNVVFGSDRYCILSEAVGREEIKGVYCFEGDDRPVFSMTDFEDSIPSFAFITDSGNIGLVSAENECSYDIDEISITDGEMISYYHLAADGKINSLDRVESEKYSFVYGTESGYYGFDADTETSEFLTGKEDSYSKYAASSGRRLLFYTCRDNAGDYVHILDENGQLSENRYPLFADELTSRSGFSRSRPFVADDGTFYCITDDYESNSGSYILSTGPEGITERKKINVPAEYEGMELDYCDCLVFTDGIFYTVCSYKGSKCVCEINSEGRVIFISPEDSSVELIENIIRTNDGRILVQYMHKKTYNYSLSWYETGKKVSENTTTLPSGYIYSGYGEYLYLYADDDGLYGYAGENDVREIISWMDSDFSLVNSVNALEFMFFDQRGCVYYRWNGFTKYSPCDETENRKIITVASDCGDLSFRKEITEFNSKNENYRIKLVNYRSLNEFSSNGMMSSDTLTADISSGEFIPDVIITDSRGDMQFYQDMGVLADLRPFIDRDTELSYDDYFSNIFDAYSLDDRLYQLCINFTLSGMTGSREVLGDERNWTRSEFLDFAEAHDEIFLDSTSEMLKTELLYSYGFTDFKNYTCSFDSGDFVRILKLIKNKGISEEEHERRVSSYTETDYSGRFVNGNCLVENTEINNITAFDMLEKAYFKNEASFIGSPAANNGPPVINSGMIAGITGKSTDKDAAWEFVRTFISDSYQDKFLLDSYPYNFFLPVKYSAFEKLVTKAKKGGCSVTTEFYNGRLGNTGALSAENAKRLEGFIRSADRAVRYDRRIDSIILEETDMFLAGEQSAEAAAANIQKKAGLYLEEISRYRKIKKK